MLIEGQSRSCNKFFDLLEDGEVRLFTYITSLLFPMHRFETRTFLITCNDALSSRGSHCVKEINDRLLRRRCSLVTAHWSSSTNADSFSLLSSTQFSSHGWNVFHTNVSIIMISAHNLFLPHSNALTSVAVSNWSDGAQLNAFCCFRCCWIVERY